MKQTGRRPVCSSIEREHAQGVGRDTQSGRQQVTSPQHGARTEQAHVYCKARIDTRARSEQLPKDPGPALPILPLSHRHLGGLKLELDAQIPAGQISPAHLRLPHSDTLPNTPPTKPSKSARIPPDFRARKDAGLAAATLQLGLRPAPSRPPPPLLPPHPRPRTPTSRHTRAAARRVGARGTIGARQGRKDRATKPASPPTRHSRARRRRPRAGEPADGVQTRGDAGNEGQRGARGESGAGRGAAGTAPLPAGARRRVTRRGGLAAAVGALGAPGRTARTCDVDNLRVGSRGRSDPATGEKGRELARGRRPIASSTQTAERASSATPSERGASAPEAYSHLVTSSFSSMS